MNQNPINPLGDLPPIGASDLFSPYSPVVDVIIPVYRGLQETQNCLESVLAYSQTTMIEVVVINDCSPDEGMDEYLEGLARDHKITVLKSPINVGFVNAVNRGMALHPERDVVLLNSDTEVYGDWLDRLRRCAYGSSQVGTVTPFSNNATICSYPRFAQNNLLPTDWSLQALDSLFSELNHHQSVEIPTAVGFCMYITRCCLSQTGYFDAENFKRGYGEENDFSMRAMNLGFRHLLCADVFVYHKGSVSFGDETESLCDKAQEKIKELHPHYFTLVSDFCSKDPARIFRRKVDAARLMRSPRKRMLFITHALGGGTEKHVQELAKIFEFDFELFILRPTGSEEISVEWARDGEEWIIYFRLPHTYSELLNSLKTLGIFYIHFHHIIGINQQILQLPRDLGVSYDFTLHDYYPVCPQYTLTLEDGSYCGEPDAAGCNLCLSKRPAPWGMDILSWRTFFQYILIGAKRVIAPSRDVLERMRAYIPSANYVYLPHPELPISLSRVATAFAGSTLKILIVGRLSPSKGLKLLEACAIDAKIRQLPLYFRVIGFPAEEIRKYPDIPLSFYGPYIDAHLPSLIAIERVDAIFFPALWPETYSYTLSYAMRSGLPIVAPRFGAFTERLAEYPLAWLLNWDSPATKYNDLFLSLLNEKLHFYPSWEANFLSPKLFLERYLQDLPRQEPIITNRESVNISQLVPEKYYYKAYHSFECYIETLNRSDLLQVIKSLDVADDNLRIVPERLVSHVKGLRVEIDRQREEKVNLNNQILQYRSEIDQQLSEINQLNKCVAQRDENIRQLNGELLELQRIMAKSGISNFRKNILPQIREFIVNLYRSWRIFFPLRIVRAAIRGDKKFLFDTAVKYRNKLNKFRNNIREDSPQISRFIFDPPFQLFRKYCRPVIRQVFYRFFNDMMYEMHQASAFSGGNISNSTFQNISNFIPSERFENENLFHPKVTVIVPNYNHDKFLRKRLDSIYRQTYSDFSVILLDDFSSDKSKEILNEYAESYPGKTRISFNTDNTGSAFKQWQRGIELADDEIIWIAESDDFCDENFLETLVPFFMDESIQLAYARSVFIGTDDQPVAFAFDDYLSELDPDKWLSDYVESAHYEVITALGKKNTIPNVSSAIFRKPQNCSLFNDEAWSNMRICGDWVFYLHLIRGAKIAFTNRTRNYYRFHPANSSASTYRKSTYYQEHEFVAKTISQLYNVPDSTLYVNRQFVEIFWEQNMKDLSKSNFNKLYDMNKVLKSKEKRLPNILMASYSFSTGGGEIFPIRLANELKKKGYSLTFFNFNREPSNDNVRKMLSSDIPVCEYSQRMECLDKFLSDFGIEIVHTHHASTEHFFATYMQKTKGVIKHVVTMHGMYEMLEKIHVDNNLPVIMNNVDLWVYIADKNLDLFNAKKIDTTKKFIKISNGMEPPVIHTIDRKTFAIPDNAFVLCQASRAILEKGWEEAIEIVTEARMLARKDVHLILLGDGPVYNSLVMRELPDYIHLLGFKNNPVDYYAMSDMGFLASRFRGESFPLSVIECLFSGRPFIASDIGEIRNMLTTEDGMTGAVFALDDWKIPIGKVACIIADFATNPDIYNKAKSLTEKAAKRFCMESIIADYEKAYKNMLS